jgi:hypothetical protein
MLRRLDYVHSVVNVLADRQVFTGEREVSPGHTGILILPGLATESRFLYGYVNVLRGRNDP